MVVVGANLSWAWNSACFKPDISQDLCSLPVQVVQVYGLQLPVDAAQVPHGKHREGQQGQQLAGSGVLPAGKGKGDCQCQACIVCNHLLGLHGRSLGQWGWH